MTPLQILLGILVLLAIRYTYIFLKDYMKYHKAEKLEKVNPIFTSVLSFITNFFDALGVGSYATSTAVFKATGMVRDKKIPGTLNVATTLPVIAQALIFINIIEVDFFTMVSIIVFITVGTYIGAGIVSKLPEKKIQIGMGFGLIIVALIMVTQLLNFMPPGGNATHLAGIKLVVAWVGAFCFGITNCIGIGTYAPMMALLLSLGMSPRVIFPIMMGGCAYFQSIASVKFIKEGQFNRKVSMYYQTIGVLGVIVAAYLVKSLPVDILKKVLVLVLIYTSTSMFRSAFGKKTAEISENDEGTEQTDTVEVE